METDQCGVCGQPDVRVRVDGTLYAHQVDGAKCAGSGSAPVPAAGPDADQQAQPAVAPESEDEPLPGTPLARGAATTPPPDDGTDGGWLWCVTVKSPCPYLGDVSWHQANGRMAVCDAARAGHTVAGEPVHTGTEHGRDRITVTYTVPVR